MKSYPKDILVTLFIKICLLYALWFFCVKPTPSYWINSKDWFLKHSFQSSHLSLPHSLKQPKV